MQLSTCGHTRNASTRGFSYCGRQQRGTASPHRVASFEHSSSLTFQRAAAVKAASVPVIAPQTPPKAALRPAKAAEPSSPSKVVELDESSLEDFITSNSGLVMVDFYTDLCGPCRFMIPHYEKMTQIFPKIKFGKFNCGSVEHQALAKRYRVRAMPTFSLFHGGRFLEQMSGAGPMQLRQLLVHYNR